METEEQPFPATWTEAFMLGGALLVAMIVLIVLGSFIGGVVQHAASTIMKPVNHALTDHGHCSYGYEDMCHPHKSKRH